MRPSRSDVCESREEVLRAIDPHQQATQDIPTVETPRQLQHRGEAVPPRFVSRVTAGDDA